MKGKRNEKSGSDSNYSTGFAFGYFYHSIEESIERYAMESGGQISGQELAGVVGEILLSKARGTELGSTDSLHLSGLRGKATKGSKIVEQVEVVGSPRGGGSQKVKRVLSLKARKSIAKAQRARWKKYKSEKVKEKFRKKGTGSTIKAYWAKMTPLQRSEEMKRRILKRAA